MSKAFTLIELPAVIATKVISKENYGLLQVFFIIIMIRIGLYA